MVDVDEFKSFNDAYGHAAGDEILVTVARRLASTLRGHDTVARIGGDEFVVLAETPADEAATRDLAEPRADRARRSPSSIDGCDRPVSATIGCVLARPGRGHALRAGPSRCGDVRARSPPPPRHAERRAALRLEPRGQPEAPKQLGVEVVVDRRDLAALDLHDLDRPWRPAALG